MSLTSFLEKNADVREKFKSEFKKPKFTTKINILAPPIGNRTLVGIAFDYILRFFIEQRASTYISGQWVAEIAFRMFKQKVKEVEPIFEGAKNQYNKYLENGELNDELIKSVLRLSKLDIMYRIRRLEPNLMEVNENDISDVRKLVSLINPDYFNVKNICLANPTFGKTSSLVGGADADLFIDGNLIEVKTIQKLHLKLDHFYQLLGYYTLHEIAGFSGVDNRTEIKKIGIYFSRYAYLYLIDINDIINRETFPDFLSWFMERAQKVSIK